VFPRPLETLLRVLHVRYAGFETRGISKMGGDGVEGMVMYRL